MKIVLQQNRTKAFLTADNSWTSDMSLARLFASSQELWSYCAARSMQDTQMVIKFDDSRFNMTIPVSVGDVSPTRTILLVEDNADDILLMRRAFKKAGLQDHVQVVTDGLQAIAYLSGEHGYADRGHFPLPQLIVTDIKMPRMNGLEVLQWMSTRDQFRAIPKIILSSSRLDSDVAEAFSLGANTYFAKPNGFEELLVLVKSIQSYWLAKDRERPRTPPISPI